MVATPPTQRGQPILVFVTPMPRSEETIKRVNQELQRTVEELEARNRKQGALAEMGELLQSCQTIEETSGVLHLFAQHLFPDSAGVLYMADDDLFQALVSWGDLSAETSFKQSECWALRRGRAHLVEPGERGLVCRHLAGRAAEGGYVCAPLAAQGKVIGVLHVQSVAAGASLEEQKERIEPLSRWAIAVAQHLALMLTNVRLRIRLQEQAMQDPLTGLYNRRHMEAELAREVRRCHRKGAPLGLIMADIDHFKRFNDTYGHEAGDELLRAMGDFLRRFVRGEDIVCRYGGEEFLLILPETSVELAGERAETLRQQAQTLAVQHGKRVLGPITLSLGVACLPEHGTTALELLRAADIALYQAKRAGRDRVVVAPVSESAEQH
jgi:diguanylate cyclase (GGDEF)-like protein